MVETDMKEKNTGTVDLSHVGVDVVTALVNYMYGGVVEDSVIGDNLLELLKLGHQYEIHDLVEDCSQKAVVTRSNILHLGSVAELYSAKVLLKKCAEFISNDMSVLDEYDWNEELKESPKLLINIVQCLKTKDNDSNGKDVEVERFSYPASQPEHNDSSFYCGTHAITIELNRKSDLISVGLFGTRHP